MPSRADLKRKEEDLKLLTELLRQRQWSAPELAERLKVSLPTAYRRLRELAGRTLVVEVREQVSKPGPTPARFQLARSVGGPA